ncbi:hypothetical protein DY000_02047806 [Brassica cretica]|uniref:Uncharacterized protein n=1 Tax=Brassica cretica TaxID=69181 RepID=A0ABQ7EYU9_BRACR|nr:hypothetical protein DY000_02047806 [Brassica cretica]
MCYPQAGKSKSTRGKKDKGLAEPSAAAVDGVNPLNTTPFGPEIGHNSRETLMVQTNLVDTGTRVEEDPLNRNLEQHEEEVVESSNAGRHSAPDGGAREELAGRRRRLAAEPSMRDVLKALTAVATQITTLTQAFTPLYEEEFNRLRRYLGKELEDESVQVRRFFRGLRVELRTHCTVLTFRTVSELFEKFSFLETTLAEESRVKSHTQQASGSKYMTSSTRSNKETQLLFSPDPTSLEHSIRNETLDPSTDTRSPLSTEDTNLPSTDIFHPTSINISTRTSIDTEPRDMVATLILVRDDRGNLHDQKGHLRNAAGQRIDAQGAAIPDGEGREAARTRYRSRKSDGFRRITLVSIDAKPRTSIDRGHPKSIDVVRPDPGFLNQTRPRLT